MRSVGKKLHFIVPLVLAVSVSQGVSSEIKTDLEKESYSIGASTGQYLSNQIYGQLQLGAKIDMDKLLEGFTDALKEKTKLKEEEIITSLNNRAKFLNDAKEAQFKKLQAENLKKEEDFLAKNKAKKGVNVTKSGLQYEVIKAGTGEKAKPESIVIINYKASLLDGYVFDDTYERKAPAHLSMVNVVDGLKEGLMLMNPGAKYKIYIPSKLGYGQVQMRDIPPNSTLVFDIELVKVMKPGDMRPKKKFEMMGLSDSKKDISNAPH